MPVIPVVLVLVIAVAPAASVVALGLWARWLRRRAVAPRWAILVGYGLAGLGALPIVVGAVWGVSAIVGAKAGEPGEKARVLAEGISEAMNCGASGFLVAIVGTLWLGFCTWRWRRRLGVPVRHLDQVLQDSFRLTDFDTPRDAAIASARLALRAYVATAQAVHSLHVAEPARNDEEQQIRDFNLGSRYRDAAFEAIVHFQHFAELVIKSVLRADHELLVIIGERHHEMLHALLHGNPVAADDERRLQTVEASVALTRVTTLLGAGLLDQTWLFIREHQQTIERLNGLRNRLWHRGEVVLRYRALDELIGGYALTFLLQVMGHATYAQRGDLWKHKALACGLDPLPLIAAEVAQPEWSLEKVAFLKELARAAYENPLDERPFLEADNTRRRQRAEGIAGHHPEHEVDRVTRCPVCGMTALVVYRTTDSIPDDEGNERPIDFTWLARCEGCSLDLRADYGNASTHGFGAIEDYFGEI